MGVCYGYKISVCYQSNGSTCSVILYKPDYLSALPGKFYSLIRFQGCYHDWYRNCNCFILIKIFYHPGLTKQPCRQILGLSHVNVDPVSVSTFIYCYFSVKLRLHFQMTNLTTADDLQKRITVTHLNYHDPNDNYTVWSLNEGMKWIDCYPWNTSINDSA